MKGNNNLYKTSNFILNMKPRYSFSAHHTRNTENIRRQRETYPNISKKVIEMSDIILEVLDARFPQETRNLHLEELIKLKQRKLIYVVNKADLVDLDSLRAAIKNIYPYVLISCWKRMGSKQLRDQIKMYAKKISSPASGDRITVGIVGYPNTGKSSVINFLVGKSSAPTSSSAGFTKGFQKIKLTPEIVLLDSPGVIPESEYSETARDLIARHTKLGARDYSKVRVPENVVSELLHEYRKSFEEHYKMDTRNDAEKIIEMLGKQKGFLKKGGAVDDDRTARFILKEWQTGKIRATKW